MVHPAAVQSSSSFHSCAGHSVSYYSDSNPIEKHPEDDISIVETLDNKEERPDNIRSIVCANPRKKLYFNPDYFEVELLMVNKMRQPFTVDIHDIVIIVVLKVASVQRLHKLI